MSDRVRGETEAADFPTSTIEVINVKNPDSLKSGSLKTRFKLCKLLYNTDILNAFHSPFKERWWNCILRTLESANCSMALERCWQSESSYESHVQDMPCFQQKKAFIAEHAHYLQEHPHYLQEKESSSQDHWLTVRARERNKRPNFATVPYIRDTKWSLIVRMRTNSTIDTCTLVLIQSHRRNFIRATHELFISPWVESRLKVSPLHATWGQLVYIAIYAHMPC